MILHLITRLVHGGAQLNTILTAAHQARQGCEVVLASGPETGAEGSLWDMARTSGVETVVLPSLVRDPSPVKDAAALRDVHRLIRQRRPRIVHTHTSKAGLLGRVAAHRLKVPVLVHTPHGHVFHSYFSRAKTTAYVHLERVLARMTDSMVALTLRERDEHLALHVGRPEQFVVIPSGVDLSRYDLPHRPERRAGYGLPPDVTVLGCVARLAPVKGVLELVAAMPRVLAQTRNVHLVVAGDGPQRAHIEAEIARLDLGSFVTLLGRRDDVPEVLQVFDVMVIPSHNEGMGRVAVEGMACGLPIVATRVGGLRDVVEEGVTGVLVAPGDGAALAAGILELCQDMTRARAMGEAGRKRAASFSLEHMLASLDALYETLQVGNRARRC